MSIFSGLFKSRDKPKDSTSGSAYRFLFGGTTSGKAVTERSAMNDSVFDLEAYISAEFARRIGAAEEEAFLTGDGNKKPEGVFTKVAATTGGTTEIANTNITFDTIMSVTKTVSIDGTEVTFRASAAIPRLYRNKFHRDIYKDLNELQKGIDASDPESSSLDTFSLELFENIAWLMYIDGFKTSLAHDTSKKGLWKVSFDLKEY